MAKALKCFSGIYMRLGMRHLPINHTIRILALSHYLGAGVANLVELIAQAIKAKSLLIRRISRHLGVT
jgi:hypothetical protein